MERWDFSKWDCNKKAVEARVRFLQEFIGRSKVEMRSNEKGA